MTNRPMRYRSFAALAALAAALLPGAGVARAEDKPKQALLLIEWMGPVEHAERIDLRDGGSKPLPIQPSTATTIQHGFATITNFFPGTKVLAGELMEQLVQELIGPLDVFKATVFEDQYISTGGQFYELIVGHDRFIADLRPLLYRLQNQPEGLCCHPYDCAALLIAEESGVIITDGLGRPLDGPLDVTTGMSWAGYANAALRKSINSSVSISIMLSPLGCDNSQPLHHGERLLKNTEIVA